MLNQTTCRWSLSVFSCVLFVVMGVPVLASDKKPNILVIMGDDIGWFNPSAYHQGMMGIPNAAHRPDRP
jgi:hypothetical protein